MSDVRVACSRSKHASKRPNENGVFFSPSLLSIAFYPVQTLPNELSDSYKRCTTTEKRFLWNIGRPLEICTLSFKRFVSRD